MPGWTEFGLAYAVFLLSHALPVRPAIRATLSGALGRRGYLIAYGAVSLAALAWLIVAAGRAPFVPLWDAAPWMRWAPNLAMPAVCLLIACAVAAPNPLSFGGARTAAFDPDRPGIAGFARHPLLWALALWALAHVPPNGDLAHALMFGGFAAFSLVGMAAIDRRMRRQLGPAGWARLAARTATVPGGALVSGAWRPTGPPDLRRLAAGAALWAAVYWGHAPLIGVAPSP